MVSFVRAICEALENSVRMNDKVLHKTIEAGHAPFENTVFWRQNMKSRHKTTDVYNGKVLYTTYL